MRKSWLLCVLMGSLAWGQAPAQSSTAPAEPNSASAPGAAAKAPAPAAEVPESAVVLTIKGVCPPSAKAAAASKSAASKTTAKKAADCETTLTRAQFEKIANALSPNVTPQLKHQLATVLPRFMAMSDAAKEKGLDKTPHFEEMMKIVRMQVLTQELQKSVQEQADKITPEQVNSYYKEHPEQYEQFSLDRLFIPRFKQQEPEKDDAKTLTDDQRKAKEAADKAKQQEGEQEMTKLADSLRAKAAAGTDFAELQKEAYTAAGQNVEKPVVNLPKVRRTGLPPAHATVFDLKVGDVSQVISDNGGHYVYKIVSKDELPLDQALQTEIHNKLRSERMKELMDKYTNSFQAVPNEAYFGPAEGPEGMMRGPHLPPHPMRQNPNAAAPPAQSPQPDQD